jgi:hypothetical protein
MANDRLSVSKTKLLMIAGSIAGGLVVSGFGWWLGRVLGQSSSNPFGDLIGILLGIGTGYPLGVSLGLWLTARRIGHPVRFWRTLLFAVLGAGIVLLLAEPLHLNLYPRLLWALFFLLPLIAVIKI